MNNPPTSSAAAVFPATAIVDTDGISDFGSVKEDIAIEVSYESVAGSIAEDINESLRHSQVSSIQEDIPEETGDNIPPVKPPNSGRRTDGSAPNSAAASNTGVEEVDEVSDQSPIENLISKMKHIKQRTDMTHLLQKKERLEKSRMIAESLLEERKQKALLKKKLQLEVRKINEILDAALKVDDLVSSQDAIALAEGPLAPHFLDQSSDIDDVKYSSFASEPLPDTSNGQKPQQRQEQVLSDEIVSDYEANSLESIVESIKEGDDELGGGEINESIIANSLDSLEEDIPDVDENGEEEDQPRLSRSGKESIVSDIVSDDLSSFHQTQGEPISRIALHDISSKSAPSASSSLASTSKEVKVSGRHDTTEPTTRPSIAAMSAGDGSNLSLDAEDLLGNLNGLKSLVEQRRILAENLKKKKMEVKLTVKARIKEAEERLERELKVTI